MASAAYAGAPYNPRTTFGEVGLLEMPSARSAADGEISLTFGDLEKAQRFNIAFQVLPWLEGSFRYSHIPGLYGAQNYYDRSFGVKIRLLEEQADIPEVSLGMRDILGTGIYSGEYLVASKYIGDFDFTLGVGWGRFAQSGALPNPLAQIFPSFKTRGGTAATGGTVNFGQLFHGPNLGVFGGAIWRSPIENLDVVVEYSADRYLEEKSFGAYSIRSPINVGLAYRPFDSLIVSAGWFYGNSYGLTLSLNADPTRPNVLQRIGPSPPAPTIRTPLQQADALSSLLQNRATPNAAVQHNGPWVRLPNPPSVSGSDAHAIAAALMSVGTNIRDVDVMGRTLVIDANLPQISPTDCKRYANIVAAAAPRLETIALSDLTSATGRVAICPITHVGGRGTAEGSTNETITATVVSSDQAAVSSPASVDRKSRDAVAEQAIDIEALSVEPSMIWLYFSNRRYASESEAAGRISRVLMAEAPPGVEIFHIVSVRSGMAQREYQIARSSLERATLAYGTSTEMNSAVALLAPPLSNPSLERASSQTYPRFDWSIGPALREGLFDPNRPIQVQVLGVLNADVDLTPYLALETRIEADIYNTYRLDQSADSLLPHVRSDFIEYFKQGINGVSHLDAVFRTRLTRETYFEAKVGYLEDMFAGAGAQILWRPEGSRFAVGADLYQVWQRQFDRLYGLQNYHVLTGHASVYYESPWYGLNFAVHAGRYLAGDYGATVEVTRRFSSGVEVGAFATFTNVPFAKFGEGSFDKGIIIHIPLEWVLPFYSQTSYDLRLRSLTRDGGQRIEGDDSLYAETLATSYGETFGHTDDVVAP